MKPPTGSVVAAAGLALVAGLLTACQSDGGGGGSSSVHGSVYYGVGFYDPWYYGGYPYPPDIVVTPPEGGRPPGEGGARPEQPIAKPPERPVAEPRATPSEQSRSSKYSGSGERPSASTRSIPASRPTPSIPSMPRPMGRVGRR